MCQRVTVVLGYGCVCVSASATTLTVASFISTLILRYVQLHYGILLSMILNVWIFIKLLHTEVMASFAYHNKMLTVG